MSRGPLRVGLTGSIGAGKSTVAAMLHERGCRVLDLDRITHELLAAGGEAVGPVAAAFGSGVVAADGGIDRPALAALVFADADARRRLEAILHPRIRRIEQRHAAALAGRPEILVTEAALLIETGAAERYHRIVVVTAPARERERRLAARGLDPERARARMTAQMAEADKVAAADYVIDNGGVLRRTRRQVDALAEHLREDLHALTAGLPLPRRRRSSGPARE